jgi:hypothetical protein
LGRIAAASGSSTIGASVPSTSLRIADEAGSRRSGSSRRSASGDEAGTASSIRLPERSISLLFAVLLVAVAIHLLVP